jgi:hypothetical protein
MWQSEIDDSYRKSGRKVRATSDVQHTLEGLLAHQRDVLLDSSVRPPKTI